MNQLDQSELRRRGHLLCLAIAEQRWPAAIGAAMDWGVAMFDSGVDVRLMSRCTYVVSSAIDSRDPALADMAKRMVHELTTFQTWTHDHWRPERPQLSNLWSEVL